MTLRTVIQSWLNQPLASSDVQLYKLTRAKVERSGSLQSLDWTGGLDWTGELTFFVLKITFVISCETSLSCRFRHDAF